QEGQSTRGEFGLNLGICVYGGKFKFGGGALLPLNAALYALWKIIQKGRYEVIRITKSYKRIRLCARAI
uniref:hypothetical protein n=1 Tax=Vibrio parahaemolyticus TaxID=670 RepID=UPI0023600EBB